MMEENICVDDIQSLVDAPKNDDEEKILALLRQAMRKDCDEFGVLLIKKVSIENPSLSEKCKLQMLHGSIECEKHDFVYELLKLEVNLTKIGSNGFTPLHHAVDIEADGAHQSGLLPKPIISKYFLEIGLDPHLMTDEGKTVIELAEEYEYTAFLELIPNYKYSSN